MTGGERLTDRELSVLIQDVAISPIYRDVHSALAELAERRAAEGGRCSCNDPYCPECHAAGGLPDFADMIEQVRETTVEAVVSPTHRDEDIRQAVLDYYDVQSSPTKRGMAFNALERLCLVARDERDHLSASNRWREAARELLALFTDAQGLMGAQWKGEEDDARAALARLAALVEEGDATESHQSR